MVRITKQVFIDLALWMIGLGLLMGCLFPPFSIVLGLPVDRVLSPGFFMACIAAGLVVGGANIAIARGVVRRRLVLLAGRMRSVEAGLQSMARSGDVTSCTPERCSIEVDSEDEFGQAAEAFNRLVEALASSHQTEAAVRSFSVVLASELELDVLAPRALTELLVHAEASAGAIIVAAEGEVRVLAAHAIRDAEQLPSSDHVRRTLRTGERQSVTLPADVRVEGILTEYRPREVLVEPIVYKGLPLGAVVLATAQAFAQNRRARVELFSQGLALALNNAMVHDRLQRLAALDPLTGLYNRRFGLARLHEEFGRAVRASSPLGVVMFDIDHFKKVNDTYGHLTGDRVLARVARIARSVMREGDVLLRYGGEEFLAALPAASRDNAVQVAERLRRAVEDASVTDGEATLRVTVSLGVCAYPEAEVTSEEGLVANADKALYSAKGSGRNRVVAG